MKNNNSDNPLTSRCTGGGENLGFLRLVALIGVAVYQSREADRPTDQQLETTLGHLALTDYLDNQPFHDNAEQPMAS